MKSATEACNTKNRHQKPSHVGGRRDCAAISTAGRKYNSKTKARKKTIFSAPASINVETERRKRKTLVWQMSPGPTPCPAAALQVPISEHLRCQHNRHKDTESNLKRTCVLQEKHCPASCGELRAPLGPPAEGRSVPSKILEWMRDLLLSQSALLGRPDCNESSQTKRDLLAAPSEPAQATLSG